MRKNNNGVTLIALIVTIIVLIIIAGISIATLTGDNGVLQQTNAARVTQIEGTAREQVELACSAVKLAVEEAVIKDKNYSAVQNSDKIQSVLLDILENDKASLEGNFSYSETEAEKGQSKIEIVYEGEDYKNATNNPDAKIKYTIALDKKTIELYKVQTSIQKDSEGEDLNINIGEDLKPGLYKLGSNYNEPDITWDELIESGVIHVNDGVVTTNYTYDAETETTSNSSSKILDGVLVLDESVTTIGRMAFRQCEKLTSVKIPASVTSIDVGGFYLCTGLTSVEIPNSVQTMGTHIFYGCTNLTSVELPDNMTSIPQSMFYECANLRNIEIPQSVIEIGKWAFRGCTLKTIKIPNSVESIGSYAFQYAGITSIGPEGSGASVEIPNSVTNIELGAFYGCTSLTSVEWPASITSIADGTFANCTSLSNIEIPNGVTTIGKQVFQYTAITNLSIPASVTSIGTMLFYGNSKLISIEVAEGNTKYHSAGNCIIETETKTIVLGSNNSTIPTDGSVTKIGDYAFEFCSTLSSINIPESVTSIGKETFRECTSLAEISLPTNISDIRSLAFYKCENLKKINFSGTSEQWKSITFGTSWNDSTGKVENSDSYEFEIVCTGETPNVTIKYVNGVMQEI